MRTLLVFSVLLVSACSSMHEGTHSMFYDKQPGISSFDFDTETKQEREEKKWWGSFYGTSTKADE